MASPIFSFSASMKREKDNKDDIVGFLSRKLLMPGGPSTAENPRHAELALRPDLRSSLLCCRSVADDARRDDQRLPSSFFSRISPPPALQPDRGRAEWWQAWREFSRCCDFLLCCYATAAKRLYRSLSFVTRKTFYHNIAQIKMHPGYICSEGALICQADFSLSSVQAGASPFYRFSDLRWRGATKMIACSDGALQREHRVNIFIDQW